MKNYNSLFLVSVALFMLLKPVAAQEISIHLKGEIFDQERIGIANCTIQIKGVKSNIVYSYFNTGNNNTFETVVKINSKDTLLVHISHIGYLDSSLVVQANNISNDIFINIVLRLKNQMLNEVIIKGPPTWKRGDTTFFKTNAFMEGEERKLKDLIIKIPGFELNEEGNLLYHKKKVDKITIDGQELFTDKVKLLLNNFPVHVLNTIQAIENQSDNALSKGIIKGSSVFVNLGLNKSTVKTAFGDGEIGLGTSGKYSVNPVLLSMMNKIQIGFIGNWNSLGKGIGWMQENEVKQKEEQNAENWILNNHPLTVIPNFETKWYINNRQWDNRIQLNMPFGKMQSKTEMSYINDRQLQNGYADLKLYNGSSFISRRDSNDISYKPKLFSIQQSLNRKIDSTKELKLVASYFKDFSKGMQHSRYIQNNDTIFQNNSIENDWESFSVKTEYLRRVSVKTLAKSSLTINHQTQRQQGLGYSPLYPAIYNTSNGDFTHLNLDLTNRLLTAKLELERIKVLKKGSIGLNIFYQITDIGLKNNFFLSEALTSSPKLAPADLNNEGKYRFNKVGAGIERRFYWTSAKSLSLSFYFDLVHASTKENTVLSRFQNPEYSISGYYNHKLFKVFSSSWSMSLFQAQAEPYQITGYLRPTSLNSYSQYENIQLPLRGVNINYSIGWTWPHNLSSGSLGLFYNKNFSGFASGVSLRNFVEYGKDSLVSSSSSYLSLFTYHEIPSAFLMALIKIKASYNTRDYLLIRNGQLLVANGRNITTSVSVKKKINKKYIISLQSSLTYYTYKLPKSIIGQTAPDIVNVKSSIVQNVPLTKQINFVATLSLFNNNIFTENNAAFLFSDIECNFKFKKVPFNFSISGENLTNQRYYFSNNNNLLSQSFYSIPLVRRRIFISMRYNF